MQGIERPRTTDKCHIEMIMDVKIMTKENPKGGQRGNPGNIKERRWRNKPQALMNNELSKFADIVQLVHMVVLKKLVALRHTFYISRNET